MPKKNKSQSNGFYVYMQELRQSLMSENKGNKITIENMIAIAGPKWKVDLVLKVYTLIFTDDFQTFRTIPFPNHRDTTSYPCFH